MAGIIESRILMNVDSGLTKSGLDDIDDSLASIDVGEDLAATR